MASAGAVAAMDESFLMAKSVIWRPIHGDVAFTVRQFDDFMRRTTPGGDWRVAR